MVFEKFTSVTKSLLQIRCVSHFIDIRERLGMFANSMAGIRMVEKLLKLDRTRYDITVSGAEPLVDYDRTMISLVLTGLCRQQSRRTPWR